jgi:Fe-S cluster assembly protein SufD
MEIQEASKTFIIENEFSGVLNAQKIENSKKIIQNLQIPTTKNEAWKYTRLGKIASKQFKKSNSKSTDYTSYIVSSDAYTFIFENGFLVEKPQQKIEGVTIESLTAINNSSNINSVIGKNLKLENEFFHNLNTIHATDGICIHIATNQIIDKPIQIIHIVSGEQTVATTRNVIIAEKNSKAAIIHGYFSAAEENTFNNTITEVFVSENAHLTIDKIQYESENAYLISTDQIEQEQNSTCTINTITLNGGLVRNNLNIEVNGQNCTTNLNGAYVLKGNQHVDNHTMVDHKVAHCNSNELYKGIMYDKSTGVFNGKVFVRRDAQKINAFQSNANVLIGDHASINSKPELEIYADDVKCSHGSTTGQIDEEAVFYLRARGLSEASARNLIIHAFLNEVFENIENNDVKEFIINTLESRFGWES